MTLDELVAHVELLVGSVNIPINVDSERCYAEDLAGLAQTFRRLAQNLTSKDFGNELDFIAAYNISPRSQFLLGYSYLWRGDKIIGNDDAELLYTEFTLNF